MFSCIDMRSYVSGLRGVEYRKAGKSYWPKRWRKTTLKHTHKAIDDAAQQGLFFLRIHEEATGVTARERDVSQTYMRTLQTFI